MDLDRPIAPDPYSKLPPVSWFELVSNDVADGETMAEPFTAAEDVSPHLAWSDFPAATESFLVTCFDPDAPRPQGFWHWSVVDLPRETTELPQDAGSPRRRRRPPAPRGPRAPRPGRPVPTSSPTTPAPPGTSAPGHPPATACTGTTSRCTHSTSPTSRPTSHRSHGTSPSRP